MSKGIEALKKIENACFTKIDKWEGFVDVPIYTTEHFTIIEKELKEHEQYKFIEEKLGIDLVTLFKALKNGIWIYDNGNPFFTSRIKLTMQLDAIHCSISDIEVLLKDYGKTWALTKEELEK